MVGGGGGASPSSYGGGGVSVSGGVGQQIASTLFSGTQNQGQMANLPPAQVLPPDRQALGIAATYLGGGPPVPPTIADQMGDPSASLPPKLPGMK